MTSYMPILNFFVGIYFWAMISYKSILIISSVGFVWSLPTESSGRDTVRSSGIDNKILNLFFFLFKMYFV